MASGVIQNPGLSWRYPKDYLGGIPAWFLGFSNANNAQKGKAGNCFRYFCILGGIWSIEMNFLDKWFRFSSILICIQPCEHLFTVFFQICNQKLLDQLVRPLSGPEVLTTDWYNWLIISALIIRALITFRHFQGSVSQFLSLHCVHCISLRELELGGATLRIELCCTTISYTLHFTEVVVVVLQQYNAHDIELQNDL